MSLDIECTCPHCDKRQGDEHNYTHNVVEMWEACGIYESLYKSDGRTTDEVVKELKEGAQKFAQNIEEMRKLNPPNNWGDADSALAWLRGVIREFEAHPGCIVRVSR